MKKIFLSLASLVAVLFLVFAIGGCKNDTVDNQTLTADSFNQNFLGISAITSMSAIGDLETDLQTQGQLNLSVYDSMAVLEEVESLEEYMGLVQTFISGQENFDVVIAESTETEYSNVMNVSFMNMQGETETYVMHFNEVVIENEDSVESTISGIMVLGEITYNVEGTRDIEAGEEELELIAYLDDDNYITISYEVEAEKDEYELELLVEYFANNQLVKSVEIEFEETIDEEVELSMKFLDGTYEKEFDFEIEKDGNTTDIAIELNIVDNGSIVEEWEIEILIVYNEELDEYETTYTIDQTIETESQV